MNKLPDKISDLLRLAVSDSKKIEGRSDHQFKMGYWLVKDDDGMCYTCMAGAIMLCTLKMEPHNQKDSMCRLDSYFEDKIIQKKFIFLNEIREGFFASNFINSKYYSTIKECEKLINNDYDSNLDRANWDTYLEVADMLESIGL